jgi:chromosomal replication initiation ATPase DnaA
MNPSWRQIAADVAQKHGVTFEELQTGRRFKRFILARHEAVWRVRHETKLSTTAIGQRFGYCDHTPVLFALKAHERRMAG